MEDITVAEFLEFELYFELALYLGIEMHQLSSYKRRFPEQFATALMHVLDHVVTSMCRCHIKTKLSRRREEGKAEASPVQPD